MQKATGFHSDRHFAKPLVIRRKICSTEPAKDGGRCFLFTAFIVMLMTIIQISLRQNNSYLFYQAMFWLNDNYC